jgi:hypothetical protein
MVIIKSLLLVGISPETKVVSTKTFKTSIPHIMGRVNSVEAAHIPVSTDLVAHP